MSTDTHSPDHHDCIWHERYLALEAQLKELQGQLDALRRQVFGKKSEKMPPVREELRKKDKDVGRDPAEAERQRKANAAARKNLPKREIEHKVPKEQRTCPECGCGELKRVGEGRRTEVIEYIPAHFERQIHIQETLACPCCDHIVTAKGPTRVVEGGDYGPGFISHIIVSKLLDALPFYRMEKQYKRDGVRISRSTMCDLFHSSADLLRPIYELLLARVAAGDMMQADETVLKVQATGKAKRAYVWTFINGKQVAYVFSPSRSGETPRKVLGGTTGTLMVDGYTGYNDVCLPDGRVRAGCWAHARRKFFDSLNNAPADAEMAMEYILKLYEVEWDAIAAGIRGSDAHINLRQTKSKAVLEAFGKWLSEQQGKYAPKEPMGNAIGYALNNWEELGRFINDVRIPLDNNNSERKLRVVALGRKNYLFVGNEVAGENLAMLLSLAATCEEHGVNPIDYFADVLQRVHTHPNSRLDELLPDKWRPPPKDVEPDSTDLNQA